MAALDARPGVVGGEEDWLVLITSDHGGQGTGHHAAQGPINWEVPFVISGESVPPGTELPVGSLRDVVPTALWHLGIDPFAFDLDGSIRGLPVGPLNGILADINQDGVVSGDGTGPIDSDDVSAFVAGWLTQGPSSMSERFARGDLNLDGITDLADWAILQRENAAMAGAVWQRIAAVPEPTGSAPLLLLVLGSGALAAGRRRRK